MKKTIRSTLLVLMICCGISCDSLLKDDQVQIRIQNISSFEYLDVRVNTNGGEQNYGSVQSNTFSEYKSFDLAYRYAFVELKIDSDTFTLQPIDYVGEEPLESGNYTYVIDASEEGGKYERLSLVLLQD